MTSLAVRLLGGSALLLALAGCGTDSGSSSSTGAGLLVQPQGAPGATVQAISGALTAGSGAGPAVTIGGVPVSSVTLTPSQTTNLVIQAPPSTTDILVAVGNSGIYYDINVANTAAYGGSGQFPLYLALSNVPAGGVPVTIETKTGSGPVSGATTLTINPATSSSTNPPPPPFT